jgi:hypothetical protein
MYPQDGHRWCACSGSIGCPHASHGGRTDPAGRHEGSAAPSPGVSAAGVPTSSTGGIVDEV